jgi:hypothetical protein
MNDGGRKEERVERVLQAPGPIPHHAEREKKRPDRPDRGDERNTAFEQPKEQNAGPDMEDSRKPHRGSRQGHGIANADPVQGRKKQGEQQRPEGLNPVGSVHPIECPEAICVEVPREVEVVEGVIHTVQEALPRQNTLHRAEDTTGGRQDDEGAAGKRPVIMHRLGSASAPDAAGRVPAWYRISAPGDRPARRLWEFRSCRRGGRWGPGRPGHHALRGGSVGGSTPRPAAAASLRGWGSRSPFWLSSEIPCQSSGMFLRGWISTTPPGVVFGILFVFRDTPRDALAWQ